MQVFPRYAQDKGEAIMRAYTPTSSDEDLGHFDLVVKVYFANEHPSYPLVRKMHFIFMKAVKSPGVLCLLLILENARNENVY